MASKRICTGTARLLRSTAASPSPLSSPSARLTQQLWSLRRQQHVSPPTLSSSQQQQRRRHPFSTLHSLRENESSSSSSAAAAAASSPPASKTYTFGEIQAFAASPSAARILIDVREPAELASTGTIPTSVNVPVASAPDAFFLPAAEFETRFGFERPGEDKEVVFFCKAGVRSAAAARLASEAGFGGTVAEFPGSWNEWVERGGQVERV